MIAIVTSLVLVSQSFSGGSCPPRASFPQYRPMPGVLASSDWVPSPAPYIQPTEPARRYGLHWTKYQGVTLQVWGFISANGNVEWEPGLQSNAERLRTAKAKAANPAPVEPAKPEVETGDRPVNKGLNFGLDLGKLSAELSPKYTSNSPARAAAMIEAQADDSPRDKPFLTIIGSDQARAQVVHDWKTEAVFDGIREGTNFGEFSAADWQVKGDLGYLGGKDFAILVQRPDGVVVYRSHDFGGQSSREDIAQALRKAHPNYDPANDPGPGRKPKTPEPIVTNGRMVVAGIALVALLLVLPGRKQT